MTMQFALTKNSVYCSFGFERILNTKDVSHG